EERVGDLPVEGRLRRRLAPGFRVVGVEAGAGGEDPLIRRDARCRLAASGRADDGAIRRAAQTLDRHVRSRIVRAEAVTGRDHEAADVAFLLVVRVTRTDAQLQRVGELEAELREAGVVLDLAVVDPAVLARERRERIVAARN